MKTKPQTLGLFLLLLFFSPLRLPAEPLNVMVEDLTFVRPESWKWAEPTVNSPAVTRFLVPDSRGSMTSIDVRFYVVKKDYNNEKKSLKGQFPQAKPGDLHEQEIKIGKRKVVYFEISGTYVYHDHPRDDQLVVGAAVPMGNQYVYARIQGPRAETESQISTFKNMMEDAVKEREQDLADKSF